MRKNLTDAVQKILREFDPHATVTAREDDERAVLCLSADEDGLSRLLERLTRPMSQRITLRDDPAIYVHDVAQRSNNNLHAYAELLLAAWMANFDVKPRDAVLVLDSDPWHPGHFRVSVERKEDCHEAQPPQPDLPPDEAG